MALWKDNTAPRQTSMPAPEDTEPSRYDAPSRFDAPSKLELAPTPAAALAPRANTGLPRGESLIAADITIEGKIEGGGSVRIAGKFKGDVSATADSLIIDGRTIKVLQERDPAKLPWKDLQVDIVVESTGFFTDAT